MGVTKGTWLGIPDWGITEKLFPSWRGNNPSQQAPSIGPESGLGGTLNKPTYSQSRNQSYQTPAIYGLTYGGVPKDNSSIIPSGGGGGGGNIPSTPTGGNDYGRDINNQVDTFGAMIDRDYEIAMSSLGQQEAGLQSQAGLSERQIRSEFAGAETSLGEEQATKEASAQENLRTGETEAKTGLQQARDLFRQIQQQNIAQLSGLGISSSSVAEAMAETLGVETARRIAGITGSLSEIRQNVTKEMGRIKNYYAEKTTQLKETMAIEIGKIQQALITGLNQINTARQQAASDKAQRRQELIFNAQTAMANLKQQEQQFQQSLQQWVAEKNAALSSVLNQDQFNEMMQKQYGVLSQQFSPTQFDITPTQSVSNTGKWSGSYNVSPRQLSKEDLIAKLMEEEGL